MLRVMKTIVRSYAIDYSHWKCEQNTDSVEENLYTDR